MHLNCVLVHATVVVATQVVYDVSFMLRNVQIFFDICSIMVNCLHHIVREGVCLYTGCSIFGLYAGIKLLPLQYDETGTSVNEWVLHWKTCTKTTGKCTTKSQDVPIPSDDVWQHGREVIKLMSGYSVLS